MPSRTQPHPSPSFTWGNLINLAAIPLVGAAFTLIGWYFLSSDTLKRHDDAIKQLQIESKTDRDLFRTEAKSDRDNFQAAIKANQDHFVVRVEEEKKARESVRNEFLASQSKLIEVLGKVDTRLSVGEKQQEAQSRQIDKLIDSVQRVPVGPPIKLR